MQTASDAQPLQSLDEWEDSLVERYPTPTTKLVGTNPDKTKEQFRNYEANARPSVREFYRLNHTHQSYDFVQAKRKDFLSLSRKKMSVWEAMEFLNTLVDDSDPDTDMTQLEHLLQTAEQIRQDGHPRCARPEPVCNPRHGQPHAKFRNASWRRNRDQYPSTPWKDHFLIQLGSEWLLELRLPTIFVF